MVILNLVESVKEAVDEVTWVFRVQTLLVFLYFLFAKSHEFLYVA